ncbi:hypothetical protein [Streptomyces boninensis]|uniref:hypothetical protein n=1 Tax=Streptomyces boninensis TaxID=2039455 RepID=UPI003B2191DE
MATAAPPAPPPSPDPLAAAEHFMWLTARVLEQRRLAHCFRPGSAAEYAADAVVTALEAYRSPDGGYAHGLDPDLRGPVSQPAHAAYALRVLDAADRCAGRRVEDICRYLTAVSTPDGALPAVDPALRGYPHAPWLAITGDRIGDLTTTGPIVGLLHRNEVWHAWLFRATDFCWAAIDSIGKTHPYEAEAAVAFLDGSRDRPRAEAAADRLGRLVREQRLAVLEPERRDRYPVGDGYAPGDHHFPHDYARRPDSVARRWFSEEELARSLDYLAAEQQDDGGWPVRRRSWAQLPALESRPIVTLEALLTLRAYGRLG